MKLFEVVDKMKAIEDGKSFTIKTTKELPLNAKSKKEGITAIKETVMPVVKGLVYEEVIKDKIDSEGYEPTHQLPWGKWSEDYENIIEHKDNYYVRLYADSEGKATTTYFVDGEEKTYDELKDLGILVNSFFNKKDSEITALTINVENILEIN